jgi:hypothetical protein
MEPILYEIIWRKKKGKKRKEINKRGGKRK